MAGGWWLPLVNTLAGSWWGALACLAEIRSVSCAGLPISSSNTESGRGGSRACNDFSWAASAVVGWGDPEPAAGSRYGSFSLIFRPVLWLSEAATFGADGCCLGAPAGPCCMPCFGLPTRGTSPDGRMSCEVPASCWEPCWGRAANARSTGMAHDCGCCCLRGCRSLPGMCWWLTMAAGNAGLAADGASTSCTFGGALANASAC